MQPVTITLPVDILNNGTTTDRVYSRFDDTVPNRSTYSGPAHTLVNRDQMQLYRTFPKRSGLYLGNAKSTVKFTEDIAVIDAEGNNIKGSAIAELSFSLPVGMTAEAMLAFRQRSVAALDHAFMVALQSALEI